MDEAINIMLARYNCQSYNDYTNALKEITQEITLLALWRAKFFEKAAFYGGTALRILYGLDRFSEDLDFSLLKSDKNFKLTPYFSSIKAELTSFGFDVVLDEIKKSKLTAIQSAFLKLGTKEHLLKIRAPDWLQKTIHNMELLKIKFEIDIDPPGGFNTEAKLLLQPIPFMVNTYQLPDLFAGKLHAILCRQWQGRVKGRDWYDLVWYVGRNIPVDLNHLEKRLQQSGHWQLSQSLTHKDLTALLINRIEQIDFAVAAEEVMPFITDHHSVQLWSKAFFTEVVARIQTV
ncbi:nucleotidyl transferase AbiEii/AbiGii toxin family protein [soil metagenome]